MTTMDFVFNSMPRFDQELSTLSEWLVKLEHRFHLAEIDEDIKKISLCALFIGQTGEDILLGLADGTTWEAAKNILATRLGEGTDAEEAWASLKNITRGTKKLVDLGSQIEKLVERAYPRQPETQQRHAIDAFVKALDGPLAKEVLKLGHRTLTDVVAAARRLEKLDLAYPTPGFESVSNMIQEGFAKLRLEMKEPKTPDPAVRVAQERPSAPSEAENRPPPIYTDYRYPAPIRSRPERVLDYEEELPRPRHEPPRYENRTRYPPAMGRTRGAGRYPAAPRPRRCFLCDEEGHFVAGCPLKQDLKRFRRINQVEQLALPSPENPAHTAPGTTPRAPALN